MVTSYQNFFNHLSSPDPDSHDKDGSQFLIGPCNGRRRAANIPHGNIFVLDADKSLDATNMAVDGAPPPIAVHEALKAWNISHCVYTTFSHGQKGNRYRVIFPYESQDKNDLKAMALYVVDALQNHANLPIALSPESFVWGQGWALPRVPYEGADFEFYVHFGVQPVASGLLACYAGQINPNPMPKGMHDGDIDEHSPIGLVNKCLPVQWQLAERGYTYVSQGVMVDCDNREVPVLRYRKPESTSAPGVVVFFSRGRWRVYSHHANDPLNNGHSNDAFDVYQLLNGYTDQGEAMLSLVPTLQEYLENELNEEYPSIMEGGSKFRYGNKFVDDFGCETYRTMEQAAFTAAMRNQPGVPTVITDEDGSQHLKMENKSEYWFNCRRRIMYNGLRYAPCPILEEPELELDFGGKKYFNTFRDWNLRAIKGCWPLLEWHLRHAVCGDIDEQFNYLLDWFAHMFQYPEEKPQVALVLQGGRGWGKTIIFSELAKQLGTHAFVAGNNRLLTGNFNSHMRGKLLLVVEESFWAGHHRDVGTLQHIISDEVTGYEKKGHDAESGKSFLRVAMTTNADWAAPVARDSRRFFIPSITSISKERDLVGGVKGHFFPKLLAEMRNGGMEAFARDMAVRELDRNSIRTIPITEKLIEQKQLSMDWMDKWLLECLTEKSIKSQLHGVAPWTESGCMASAEQIKESLKTHATLATHYTDKGLMTAFGVRLKKVFHPASWHRKSGADGSKYVFTGLSKARDEFERYVEFPVEWGTEDTVPGQQGTGYGIHSRH